MKTTKNVSVSGDNKHKAMILSLDPQKHAWIKKLAESNNMTQPNVVNFVLSRVMSDPAIDYVGEIKRQNAAEQLKNLEEQQRALDLAKQKLKDMLSD